MGERLHDLPPKWDGRAVIWLGWEYAQSSSMTMFHTRVLEVCEHCGIPTTERGFPCWSTNYGMLANSAGLMFEDYAEEERVRARLPERIRHKAPRHWWRTLVAFRCHHCKADQVWDTQNDETWDLDASDYGDEGSVA